MKILRLLPLLLLLACEKEGLQGPAGPQGNANVQAATYMVSNWQYSDPTYFVELSVPFITADIVASGAVLTYIETGANQFTQVPLTFYRDNSYSTTIEVSSSIGFIRLYWGDSDLTQPIAPPSLNVKVVAVASSLLRDHPNLDLSDYQTVKKAFTLK